MATASLNLAAAASLIISKGVKAPVKSKSSIRNRRKLRNRIERFFNKLNTPETSLRATIAAPSIFLPHSTSPAL